LPVGPEIPLELAGVFLISHNRQFNSADDSALDRYYVGGFLVIGGALDAVVGAIAAWNEGNSK
jgi:hypothetical protein